MSRGRRAQLLGLGFGLALAGRAGADAGAERARLVGQRVGPRDGGYALLDVAGLGRPRVGVIAWKDGVPWLEPVDQDAGLPPAALAGPLAVPRLLAPGYKVWLLAPPAGAGQPLTPTRFGVLARPGALPR